MLRADLAPLVDELVPSAEFANLFDDLDLAHLRQYHPQHQADSRGLAGGTKGMWLTSKSPGVALSCVTYRVGELMIHNPKLAMLATAVAGLVLMMPVSPATANWFSATGNGGGGAGSCTAFGNITDDKNVDFYNVDPSAELSDGSGFTRATLLDPTALTVSYTSPQNNSIDVLLGDLYYDSFCEAALGVQWTTDGFTGLRGLQTCDYLNGNRCGQAVVRISNHFFDAHNQQGDRWIVCHEVGHAIGLGHRDPDAGCMRNNVDASTPSYTTHDRGHINSNWATEPAS